MLLSAVITYTPLTQEDLTDAVGEIIPKALEGFMMGMIADVYERAQSLLPVAAVILLWTAGKGVLSIVQGLNAIHQVERLPLMVSILIHGGVLYIGYLLTYLVNDWLEWGTTPILVFSGIFVAGYLVIWAIIYAVTKGYLNNLSLSQIPEFEKRLEEFMDTRYEGVLTAIRQTGKLESDTEEQLKAALNELLDQFNPQV